MTCPDFQNDVPNAAMIEQTLTYVPDLVVSVDSVPLTIGTNHVQADLTDGELDMLYLLLSLPFQLVGRLIDTTDNTDYDMTDSKALYYKLIMGCS